ncbi:MAG: hypothetical protein JOZ16_14175 [Methylobacteriaceae bacterium]|nr:hypothetical protein [Methylobacteriaceae bacterium]
MLKFILAPVLALAIVSVSFTAEAKPGGCLKYGAAGAVAGHYAGHHGFVGAVAGCALGMRKRREYKREMRMQHQSAAPGATQRPLPTSAQPRAY